jgi:hypothetical protein
MNWKDPREIISPEVSPLFSGENQRHALAI